MIKTTLATVFGAAALTSAPAIAQDNMDDGLIPIDLVSMEEIKGAEVYYPNGRSIGTVTQINHDDGEIDSLLVYNFLDRESVVGRYRISGDDIGGYDDEAQSIVLGVDEGDEDWDAWEG